MRAEPNEALLPPSGESPRLDSASQNLTGTPTPFPASDTQRPKPITLTATDLATIGDLLTRGDAPHRVLERCRILKLSHEGVGPTEIARQVPWARQAICRLRARYRVEGAAVLFDRPRGPRAMPKPPRNPPQGA